MPFSSPVLDTVGEIQIRLGLGTLLRRWTL